MLRSGSDIASSILIQLGTDKRVNGERGWWGDQFLGFEIGTRLWTNVGSANSSDTLPQIEEAAREGLDPFISQDEVDDVFVRAVDTIDGPEVRLRAFRQGVEVVGASL